MEISPQRIEEFKTTYESQTGIALSDAEAREKAMRLLSFARLCAKSTKAIEETVE